MRFLSLLFALLSFVSLSTAASTAQLSVDATANKVAVSPLVWGIFFEEINHAGQGGLYSQLVSNTNFEYVDFWPWTVKGATSGVYLALSQDQPLNYKNLQHLKVSFASASTSTIGITNPGFYGMTFTANTEYTLSFYAYADSASPLPAAADLIITLEDASGTTQAKAVWSGLTRGNWSQYRTTLSTSVNVVNGSLSIYFPSVLVDPSISLHFDMVSLMPVEGWNGLPFIRSDLGQMIADMHPAFVRFPGGCYVEGDTLDHRFNWKNSIGALETRPGHYDLWDYYSEDGLGYLEYLMFIEKLTTPQGTRVEPVWVVNNGVSHADSIPTNDLHQWIVDALDSLEFAMGDVSTKYGAMRHALGHPAPFPINIMAIGNEDCGKPYYLENYNAFYAAIKAVYPNMTLIANCDLTSSGGTNELWDFHVYQNANWFLTNLHQWDSYNRNAYAKVFESEYAVTDGCGLGNVNAGIAEAAYMTGLERNSDVVQLASYAPLLVNSNDRKWNPDAIVFDSYRAYGTPSYWVQYMFANAQQGTVLGSQYVLSSSVSGYSTLAVSTTIASVSGSSQQLIIVKAVNYDQNNDVNVSVTVQIPSGKTLGSSASVSSLSSGSINDENTFANPTLIVPKASSVNVSGNTFTVYLPKYSAHIIRVPLN